MKSERSEEKSPAELERDLLLKSRQYMRGEITVEQLEEAERPHLANLKEAVLAIAKRNLEERLVPAAPSEQVSRRDSDSTQEDRKRSDEPTSS